MRMAESSYQVRLHSLLTQLSLAIIERIFLREIRSVDNILDESGTPSGVLEMLR